MPGRFVHGTAGTDGPTQGSVTGAVTGGPLVPPAVGFGAEVQDGRGTVGRGAWPVDGLGAGRAGAPLAPNAGGAEPGDGTGCRGPGP